MGLKHFFWSLLERLKIKISLILIFTFQYTETVKRGLNMDLSMEGAKCDEIHPRSALKGKFSSNNFSLPPLPPPPGYRPALKRLKNDFHYFPMERLKKVTIYVEIT